MVKVRSDWWKPKLIENQQHCRNALRPFKDTARLFCMFASWCSGKHAHQHRERSASHTHGLTVERPKLIVRNVDWPCLDKFSFPQEARVQILRRRRSKGRGVVCRKSSCGVACSRKTFSPTLQAVRSNPSVCLLCICVTCVRRPVPHLCTPRYIKHVTVTNLRTISYALLRANYIAN